MKYRIRELDFNNGQTKPIFLAEGKAGWFTPWVPIGGWEEQKLFCRVNIRNFIRENSAPRNFQHITRFHAYEIQNT